MPFSSNPIHQKKRGAGEHRGIFLILIFFFFSNSFLVHRLASLGLLRNCPTVEYYTSGDHQGPNKFQKPLTTIHHINATQPLALLDHIVN